MLAFSMSNGRAALAKMAAIDRSLALIEFDLTGTIVSANANFCSVMGYERAEIVGRHHSMFVEPDLVDSAEYKEFWASLARGTYDARQFKRLGKGGREIWIQASYNPVMNRSGKVWRVMKVATDITESKLKALDSAAKINAISKAQAVIEFTPHGQIVTANQNFLDALGYNLGEITGQHHRLFVEQTYASSTDYQRFWDALRSGQFVASEFKRIGKNGKEVWIQASYNPVFNDRNAVIKVVKFATDVTERVRAVQDIGSGLSALAQNDLEVRISRPFPEQFEPLREDFNVLVDRLRHTMCQILENAHGIEAGTREIAIASGDLSRRTEQQAANLEETAAALDEVTSTVKRSAEGASHARDVVANADADARKSADVVREAIRAMEAISKSSSQVSQIIGVIDEIAFQTNLLALNAGVEAARAGEAGRGFAVVASEVRALAQRSAEAAKEIKGLISTSAAQVDSGVRLVTDTGQSLERIQGQVAEINDVISHIAAASQEQALSLGEVNTAVNQMDQTTQQNAAMVEQSTAAAQSLSNETAQMVGLISQFKIGHLSSEQATNRIAKTSTMTKHSKSSTGVLASIGDGRAKVGHRAPNGGGEVWQDF